MYIYISLYPSPLLKRPLHYNNFFERQFLNNDLSHIPNLVQTIFFWFFKIHSSPSLIDFVKFHLCKFHQPEFPTTISIMTSSPPHTTLPTTISTMPTLPSDAASPTKIVALLNAAEPTKSHASHSRSEGIFRSEYEYLLYLLPPNFPQPAPPIGTYPLNVPPSAPCACSSWSLHRLTPTVRNRLHPDPHLLPLQVCNCIPR